MGALRELAYEMPNAMRDDFMIFRYGSAVMGATSGAKAPIQCEPETAGLKACSTPCEKTIIKRHKGLKAHSTPSLCSVAQDRLCSTLLQLHSFRVETFFKRMMRVTSGAKAPIQCGPETARLKPCSSTLRGKRVEASVRVGSWRDSAAHWRSSVVPQADSVIHWLDSERKTRCGGVC